MASSAVTPGKTQAKPRRGGGGLLFLLFLIVILVIALFGIGFLAPTRLAQPQEYLVGVLHGGVANVDIQTQVECVPLEESGGVPQAITRTSRVVTFGDNSTLSTTYRTSPTPTQLQCVTP